MREEDNVDGVDGVQGKCLLPDKLARFELGPDAEAARRRKIAVEMINSPSSSILASFATLFPPSAVSIVPFLLGVIGLDLASAGVLRPDASCASSDSVWNNFTASAMDWRK